MGNLCSRPDSLYSPRGGAGGMGGPAQQQQHQHQRAAPGERATANGGLVFKDGAWSPQEAAGRGGGAHRPANILVPGDYRGQQANGAGTPTTTTTSNSRGGGPEQQQQQQHEAASRPPAHDEEEDEDGNDGEPDILPPAQWQKGKLIGQGAFGRVYKGLISSTGQEIAIKQVSLPRETGNNGGKVSEHIRALETEVGLLRTLRHENIVQYLGTERTDEHLNIFLEYVPGGSIANKMMQFGPLREETIKIYTKQILRGLDYLHQRKIMHRDIKGANILTDSNGIIKLADFGASKKIEDLATIGSGCKSIKGTPYWMAPEVIKQTGHGRQADIWSLGCVVIEMATGKPPWSNCHTQVAAMFHIASTKEPPQFPEQLSPAAKDFLLLCFNRVPKERPNAARLLKHPWLVNVVTPVAPAPMVLPMVAPMALPPAPGQPQLPLQQQRSPPSPIKEEPDSRYNSPAGGPSTMSRTAHLQPQPQVRTTSTNASGRFQPDAPQAQPQQQPQQRPVVPPLPLDAMKRGTLHSGGGQGPQQQQGHNGPVGMPPRPPVAGLGGGALQQQPSRVQQQQQQQPARAPPPQQQLQPQYDTVVSPPPMAVLLAAAAAGRPPLGPTSAEAPQPPAAGTPQRQPAPQVASPSPQTQGFRMPPPQQQQQAQQQPPQQQQLQRFVSLAQAHEQPLRHLDDDDDVNMRASTMTLSGYNPMEEPSWMPQQQFAFGAAPAPAYTQYAPRTQPHHQQHHLHQQQQQHQAPGLGGQQQAEQSSQAALFRQLAAIRESDSAAASPAGSAGSRMPLAPWGSASPQSSGVFANAGRDQASRGAAPAPALPLTMDLQEDKDTLGWQDQPAVVSPAAGGTPRSTAGAPAAAAGADHQLGSAGKQLPAAAAAGPDAPRPRVSASRRVLEEAGILVEAGTDAARAQQWRDELFAELDVGRERMRAQRESFMVRPPLTMSGGGE